MPFSVALFPDPETDRAVRALAAARRRERLASGRSVGRDRAGAAHEVRCGRLAPIEGRERSALPEPGGSALSRKRFALPLSTYQVAGVMQRNVATIEPDGEIQQVFREIAGTASGCFVVVDEERRPLGIVTDGDVISTVLGEQVPGGSYLRAITSSIEGLIEHLDAVRRASGDRCSDWMTSPVVTVEEDDTLQRAAELFAEHHFRRLPVVREGRLVGLVRRIDLLGPMIKVHDEAQRADA